MKKALLLLLLTLPAAIAYAQQQPPPPPKNPKDPDASIIIDSPIAMDTSKTVPYDPNRIFTVVEKAPEFPGGVDKFFEYIYKNLRYPDEARRKNIQGRVLISFVVEKDGSLTDIKVQRSVSTELDAEAIRLLKACPNWIPGTQNGRPVRVSYIMPIVFKISNSVHLIN